MFLDRFLRRGSGPLILMYHRVAEPAVDPWGLAVSPANFRSQLDALAAARSVVSMTELVERLRHRAFRGDEIALTFDDGYSDNLRAAAPALNAAKLPATLFVMTAALGREREFWWDELARLILLPSGPARAAVTIGEASHDVRLGIGRADPLRRDAMLAVWRALRSRPLAEIEAVLDALAPTLGAPPADPADFPLTARDLAGLAGGPFEIGGHTVTHPALTGLSEEAAAGEIAGGKLTAEALIGRTISGFSYPYGDCDAATAGRVERAGFRWACTTVGASVTPSTDPLLLPRVAVPDVPGDELLRRLERIRPRRARA